MRFLLRVTLEGAGYEVVEAHNGAVALERAKESRPDLVVTDLMMPVMGGRELIDRLRSNPDLTTTPILILSANWEPAHRRRGRRARQALRPRRR